MVRMYKKIVNTSSVISRRFKTITMKNSIFFKTLCFLTKMTTRSQTRKAVELHYCKGPKLHSVNLDAIETSLRQGIMSDWAKMLAENQKEMLKLITSTTKKVLILHNLEDCDSEAENTFTAPTSTPIKSRATLRTS